VECERRLADEHAASLADRDHQRRLYQLVRAVARDHAVRAPTGERRKLLVQTRGHEVGITRPSARAHAPQRLLLDRLRQVPGVLVLVYLHRRAVGRQRVSLQLAHARLDFVQRVHKFQVPSSKFQGSETLNLELGTLNYSLRRISTERACASKPSDSASAAIMCAVSLSLSRV